MRFDILTYLHTEDFDDTKEVKFATNFKNNVDNLDLSGLDVDDLTVEIWVQEDRKTVLIVDNCSNKTFPVSEREYKLVLEFASKNNLI